MHKKRTVLRFSLPATWSGHNASELRVSMVSIAYVLFVTYIVGAINFGALVKPRNKIVTYYPT